MDSLASMFGNNRRKWSIRSDEYEFISNCHFGDKYVLHVTAF